MATSSLRWLSNRLPARGGEIVRAIGNGILAKYPQIEPTLVRLWYVYVYLYVRGVGVWNSLRYDAPIDPFRIYWVDPNRIERKETPRPKEKYKYFGRVKDGDWDRDLELFEKTDLYRSFRAHFEHGVDWRDTPFFERVTEEIVDGRTRWGCSSKEEFFQRCLGLDELYQEIDEAGFRTQRELAATVEEPAVEEPIEKRRHSIVHRLIYDEITVSVGRDGEIIFNDGRHRLAIAKLLDLERVPVRIMIRHAEWQRLREAVFTGELHWETLSQELQTNPDLRDLHSESNRCRE